MGGIKDREAKKKANNVYSGGSGGGTKGPSVLDKRNQQLQCPYCERVFQQKERYNKHIDSKHAEEHVATQQEAEASSAQQQEASSSKVMQVGSKAGYYTKKSPHLLLVEQCNIDKRLKPKVKVLKKDDGKFGCRVVFPDSKKSELDVLVYLPDEYLADTEVEAKQRGSLAALRKIAGHRALERVLPEEFLPMWQRLGELQQAREAKDAARAACEQKQQARQTREKQREMKDSLTGNVVSMHVDRVDELYKLISSDELTSVGVQLDDAPVPLAAEVQKALVNLGCSQQHMHDVTVGLSAGGTLEEALDWLSLNIPNTELPTGLRAKRGGASITVVTKKNDAAIKTVEGRLLTSLGFSQPDVSSALKGCSDDPQLVAVVCWAKLLAALTGFVCPTGGVPSVQLIACLQEPPASLTEPNWADPEDTDSEELSMWWNEQLAFISVFPELVVHASQHCCRVKIEVPKEIAMIYHTGGDQSKESSAELVVVFWEGCGSTLPLIGLQCQAMPPAVRLHYTQKLYQHLREECSSTQGVLPTVFAFLSEELTGTAPSLTEARLRWGALLQSEQSNGSVSAASEEPQIIRKQKSRLNGSRRSNARVLSPEQLKKESERLKSSFQQTRDSAQGRKLQAGRDQLPAAAKKNLVLDAVSGHRVVIISGATGCGKSTQVPQFILEDAIASGNGAGTNIICTQPRRLPAVALANRVADEMCQQCGGLVGYSIRLEKKSSKDTRLLFCTTGILLRRLTSDRQLADVSHIVIDEVHERSLESDLLMLLLRDVLQENKQLKLVLMSATAESGLFASYFENGAGGKKLSANVSVVDIPGFTYPVRELSLEDAIQRLRDEGVGVSVKEGKLKDKDVDKRGQALLQLATEAGEEYDSTTFSLIAKADEDTIDYDLVEAAIIHVVKAEAKGGPWALLEGWSGLDQRPSKGNSALEGHGAILVFLPGSIEIAKLQRQLAVSDQLCSALGKCQAEVLPLHGALSPAQQQAVFRKYSKDRRKIILSTNIAETSITIDDVTVVIDTGKMKEIELDKTSGITRLAETWVSQAAAKQRRGRAGRVRPGVCIRLFSRLQWSKLRPYQLPEMLRVPLEPLCLQIKATLPEWQVEQVLANAITPPDTPVVGRAMQLLKSRQALDADGSLTSLGKHLSRMPLDPAVGKMLIFGSLLQCTDPMLTVAAAVSYSRQVFVSPQIAREEADTARRQIAGPTLAYKSDHLATVYAFVNYRIIKEESGEKGARAWCMESFVSHEGMRAIQDGRAELVNSLLDLGFVSTEYARRVRRGCVVDFGDVHDANSKEARVVKAGICAGFYPQVLRVENPLPKFTKVAGGAVENDEGAGIPKLFERAKGRVFVHPSSINFSVTKYDTGWMVYSDIVETSKVFVRQCTSVPVYSLLLFGGAVQVDHIQGKVSVDTWAQVTAPPKIGVLVRELKKRLDTLLSVKLEQPETEITKNKIISVVIDLLVTDGK